jgi:SAM-dependent methyltransferase
MPSRVDAPELLDEPAAHPLELSSNLADIRSLNRWFGGTSLVLKSVHALTKNLGQFSVLDVATGSADIPLAIHQTLARGRRVSITALDVSPEILSEARKLIGGSPIELVQGDARKLPFDDESFDLVSCSLALHHFSPEDARVVLVEMWRVASRAIILTDVYRSQAAYVAAWLSTRLGTRNRLTRHDAPLSVLRAYTPGELAGLASAADISSVKISRHLFFRQRLLARKPTAGA